MSQDDDLRQLERKLLVGPADAVVLVHYVKALVRQERQCLTGTTRELPTANLDDIMRSWPHPLLNTPTSDELLLRLYRTVEQIRLLLIERGVAKPDPGHNPMPTGVRPR